MRVTKLDKDSPCYPQGIHDNVYEVTGLAIRDYDWLLVRNIGHSTLAFIAPSEDYDGVGDEVIVIEEYSDPQHRKIIDDKHLFQLASWVHDELVTYIKTRGYRN